MKALVKTQKGKGFLEIQDKPVPDPGEGEVLLKVAACGICGTDVHIRDDEFPYWPPVIIGHEFSGTISQLGPNVDRFKVGDRVVGEPHTKACGHCYLCRTGNIQICPEKRSPGWGIDGAMTEYLVMPEKLLHTIPDAIDDITAAVIEPTANAVHDVLERATIEPGDLAVVIGPGPIGLLAAMAARAGGARDVIVIGADVDKPLRLPKARELGFYAVNVQKDKPLELVQKLSGGIGADIVIECSGSTAGIASTVELARKKGRICAIGLPDNRPLMFPYSQAAFKVLDVFFCLSTSYTSWDKSIHLVASGQLPAGKVVTHRVPLLEWERAFELIDTRAALKVVLIP
ncbi:MAG: alcohol dehydrogenase catalytic domain-containing protein [Phycisphaeraceae bacterium]|nr:alcohol dehydrogenase catalytic domain-containing protein [Phycisphaeraceae bacterium]